jgi:hypothetical protein
MTDETDIIHAFMRAWGQKDIDSVVGFFAEDAIFIASAGPEPGRTVKGLGAIRSIVSAMFDKLDSSTISTEIWSTGADHFAVWVACDPDNAAGRIISRGIDHFIISGGKITLKDAYRKIAA